MNPYNMIAWLNKFHNFALYIITGLALELKSVMKP